MSKNRAHLKVVPSEEVEGPKHVRRVRYEVVPVDCIRPNPFQPRVIFDQSELEKLAETIKKNGDVEEDIRVADNGDGTFTLINGERRWRAAQIAGLRVISAKILEQVPKEDLLEKACIANFCVSEMTLVEQAFAFRALMDTKGWSQSELARRIGKSQGFVSNALKVFNLHEDIRAMALYGKIAPGIALRLASFEKNDQAILLSACKKEIDRREGKPFTPDGLLLFLKKKAAELGIKQKRSKSRKHLSHQTMLARSVTRAAEKLINGIQELRKIKKSELFDMSPPLLDIIGTLEGLKEEVSNKIDFLNSIA